MELVGKKIGGEVSPYAVTAWRFLIGGLVLLPFAIRQYSVNKIVLNSSSILSIGFLGVLNVCASMLLLQLSIFYGKASLTAILVSINPLFVNVFAMILLKERMSISQVIGLIIGLTGILLIISAEADYSSTAYKNLHLGVVFAVLTAITFALYTVLAKKNVMTYGNMVTNSFSFLIGSTILFIISLTKGIDLLFIPSFKNIAGVMYLGIVVTGIAYLLYFEGMRVLTAGRASIYFFLKPVIASLLAYLFLAEKLTLLQMAGIGFVIISLARERLFAIIKNAKRF